MATASKIALAIEPELNQLIENISNKNTYYGNKISKSIMDMFHVELREDGAGITVPYWIGVLEKGRGPRRSSKSSELFKKIKKWMAKNGMFRSSTDKGKTNEAKRMTWYINKYGNKQFRNRVFIDVYTQETRKTITKIDQKFSLMINQITSDIL